MALSRRMVLSVLLFFVLLAASEMGAMKAAEARHCMSQSHKFKGMCMRKSNCANVCLTEGFTEGECRYHGIERKCFCKKLC